MSTVVREEREEARVHRATLPVIMLALATVVSAVASLNVAIPSIARDTHATQTQLSWIIDAYALVFAALLLLGGAIGDRYGRRRTLIAGLVIFGGASLAAMTVSGPTSLIVMRGLLGVGAALVMPATLSTITSTFPAEQRTRAVGAWAGVAGASAILGLLMSGAAARGVVVAVGVRAERRAGRRRDHRCRALHPGVRGARRAPARPCRGGAHRRGPGSSRLLGHRGADPRLGQRRRPWPASGSGC